MILGGTGLFIAGHAAFKAILWQRVSWPRITALLVLGCLGALAPHVSVLVLSTCAAAVVVAVAVADFVGGRAPEDDPDPVEAGSAAG
jgi:hypothetical protein